MINRKTINLLALFTLVGFGLLGIGIHSWTQDEPYTVIFTRGYSWYIQLATGLVYGAITGFTALHIVKSELLTPVREYYTDLIGKIRLKSRDILFISFCAGVGEEVLFRGALQPLLGLWITSILFVALHGYLNPFNWRLSVYGICLTVIIAGIGMLYQVAGIYAAMTSHAIIDIVLLAAMSREQPLAEEEREED